MNMYAGGPGGDPYMGLLGMSDPRTSVSSGLLSMGPWSQLAYQMAGSPQQGPYSAVPVPAAIPGSLPSAAAGSSGGSGVLGGLLGTVARNPKLVSQASNLVSGLLGSSPDALASAADAAVGTAVAPTIASDASGIAAANDAWLAAQPAANGALYGGATGAADAAGSGAAADAGASAGGGAAAGSALGAAAAFALPAAVIALGPFGLGGSAGTPGEAGFAWSYDAAMQAQRAATQAGLMPAAPGLDAAAQQAAQLQQILQTQGLDAARRYEAAMFGSAGGGSPAPRPFKYQV